MVKGGLPGRGVRDWRRDAKIWRTAVACRREMAWCSLERLSVVSEAEVGRRRYVTLHPLPCRDISTLSCVSGAPGKLFDLGESWSVGHIRCNLP